MVKAAALVVLAILVCALPAAAKGKPNTLDLSGASGQTSSWIEQQDDWPIPSSPIINPFGGRCLWSVNDHESKIAFGYLDPGTSSQVSACIISDFNPVYATRYGTTAWWHMAPYGFFGVSLDAPGLQISVCYQPQNRCFSSSTAFCGRASYTPDDPALQDIAGSNGGRGVVTTVTLTISNPTAHRVRDIIASWGISSDAIFPAGCEIQPTSGAYPFMVREF